MKTLVEEIISKEIIFTLPWGNVAGKMWSGNKGPNVLCIHGLFSNAACFDKLITIMVKNVGGNWCSLDLPGCGKSDNHPQGMLVDMFQFVQDLHRVIKSLEWYEFHLLAHSAGGTIAYYLTSLLQESVKSLIAIDVFTINLVLDDSLLSERFHIYLEKNLPIQKDKSIYSKQAALERIKTSRSTELSTESSKILFQRSASPVNNGYVLKNDPRFKLSFVYPVISSQMHQQLINDIHCPVLLIEFSEVNFLYDHPATLSTTTILEKNLGKKLKRIHIDGSHEMVIENPEPVIDALIHHFISRVSKL